MLPMWNVHREKLNGTYFVLATDQRYERRVRIFFLQGLGHSGYILLDRYLNGKMMKSIFFPRSVESVPRRAIG